MLYPHNKNITSNNMAENATSSVKVEIKIEVDNEPDLSHVKSELDGDSAKSTVIYRQEWEVPVGPSQSKSDVNSQNNQMLNERVIKSESDLITPFDTQVTVKRELDCETDDGTVKIKTEETLIEDNQSPERAIGKTVPNSNPELTPVYFQCSECNYRCATSDIMERHRRLHDPTRPHKCNVCGYRYSTHDTLTAHMFIHNKQAFKCKVCEYTSPVKLNFQRHVARMHAKERPFKCNLCDYRGAQRSNLQVHMIHSHTKERAYKCNFCDSAFFQSSTLNEHLRQHTQEKPFHCDLCNYKAARKCNLNRHKKTHDADKIIPKAALVTVKRELDSVTDEKTVKTEGALIEDGAETNDPIEKTVPNNAPQLAPVFFQCSDCNYRCATSDILERHRRLHDPSRPHQCNVCGYRYIKYDTLNTHMYIHNKQAFKCKDCEYTSPVRLSLQRHIFRMHTKERPFKCNLCDYKSAQKNNLQVHILHAHTKERGFKCNFCDSAFYQSTTLKKHLRQHTQEKPYECDLCDYKAARKCNLNRHKKSHDGSKKRRVEAKDNIE